MGPMGELYPTALRAELRAVNEALRCASLPLTMHTDNQQVVDGSQNGKSWSCAPERDGADIWRDIWRLLDDIGLRVRIMKVEAHLLFIRLLEGHMPL